MPKSRKTKQKEILERELRNCKNFFNAEDLMKQTSKKGLSIGIATVYRFLRKKSKNSELHHYTCKGKRIYSIDKRIHSHFICKQCGRTNPFNMEDISAIRKSVKGEICHFQLDVYGICEQCKKQNEKTRSG